MIGRGAGIAYPSGFLGKGVDHSRDPRRCGLTFTVGNPVIQVIDIPERGVGQDERFASAAFFFS